MPALTTLRAMREADCAEVSRLVCRSFQWGAAREDLPPEKVDDYYALRGSEEAIRSQFHEYQCLVAFRGETIVGMIAIAGNEIAKLYVDPDFLGQGIGTQLFEEAERLLALAGHQTMILYTMFPSNIPFYESRGMCMADRGMIPYGPFKGTPRTMMQKSLIDTGLEG